jgi:hypothetical protein
MAEIRLKQTETADNPETRDRPDAFNRIWEIHHHFKCPLIGVGLNLDEHRKILKKTKCQTKRKQPYELHRIIVGHLEDENQISLKVDRFFRHKYRNVLADLGELDEERFMAAWHEYFDSGNVDGIFYVAAVKQNLSEASLGAIYGDIHMAGHFSVGKLMQTRRDKELQTEVNKKIARLLKQEKRRSGNLKKKTCD